MDIKNAIYRGIRILFDGLLLLAGTYLLLAILQDAQIADFSLFSSGDKGKDALSGVLFSVIFISYAIWDITRLIKGR